MKAEEARKMSKQASVRDIQSEYDDAIIRIRNATRFCMSEVVMDIMPAAYQQVAAKLRQDGYVVTQSWTQYFFGNIGQCIVRW
jgi:hypothetical protein